MRCLFDQTPFIFLFPAFERRKELLHLRLCLLRRQVPARFLVNLVGKLSAELYHLAHIEILEKNTVLVAVATVVLTFAAV